MNVIIRTDAAEHIGIGHVIRCLALAQGLVAKEMTPRFHSIAYNKDFLSRVEEEGFPITYMDAGVTRGSLEDARQTIALARQQRSLWVILDGYLFKEDYQRLLKEAGLRILSIDDMASCHYVSDAVLNQNFGVKREDYSTEEYTRFFLGSEYVLVRQEFRDAAKDFKRAITPGISRVLITLGGADTDNVTLKVLQALALLGDTKIQVKVVLGYLNKNEAMIKTFAATASFDITILEDLRQGMGQLMQWADLGITAGGSTVWEYAQFATPLAGIIVVDNQQRIIEELEKKGAVFSLGWCHQGNAEGWAKALGGLCNDFHLRQSLSRSLHECVKQDKVAEIFDLLRGASV